MTLYDAFEVEEQIRQLPDPIRLHLSHVVRNGLMNILASHKSGNVEAAVSTFEARWKELEL